MQHEFIHCMLVVIEPPTLSNWKAEPLTFVWLLTVMGCRQHGAQHSTAHAFGVVSTASRLGAPGVHLEETRTGFGRQAVLLVPVSCLLLLL